jgi:hypothetical protein
MPRVLGAIVLAVCAAVAGCASWRAPTGFEPVRFDDVPPIPGGDPFPSWPVPPNEAVGLIASGEAHEVRVAGGTGVGTDGAATVGFVLGGDRKAFFFEATAVAEDPDGIDGAPRKELAAYVLQQLFLDPEEYVVPSCGVRCVPVDEWRRHGGAGDPQVPGTRCTLAIASLRLQDVTVPGVLYDRERFLTDATYARYLADFNLFTYLAGHSDGGAGTFLVSTDDRRRQVFAVDNRVTFGRRRPGSVPSDWSIIRVAALRRRSVERLRQVKEEDLRVLRVVWQLEGDATGTMRPVKPGRPMNPDRGAIVKDGVVQLGLTDGEIADVWRRIEILLEDVDAGKIPLF